MTRLVRRKLGGAIRRAVNYQVENLEQRALLSAPAQWASRGPGGGGAFFSPSFSPYGASDLWTVTDMGELFHSTSGGQSWSIPSFTEVQGGRTSQVQFTSDPKVLYTIDASNDNPVPTRSNDGGATWTPSPGWDASDQAFSNVYADPASTDRILVADYGSLYLSTDGGATFALKYTAPDPSGAGCYVAGVFFDGSNVYVGTNFGLLVSTDGGATFNLSSAGGLPAGTAMISFAGAKQNGVTRLFAVLDQSADVYPGVLVEGSYASYSGVYSLDVGQASWVSRSAGVPSGEGPVFVSMARGDVNDVYLAGSDGNVPVVLKSTNAGAAWSDVLLTTNNANVATGWQGDGGDRGWGFDQFATGFEVDPADPNHLAITGLGFLHVSDDGGATWRQAYVSPADQNPAGSPTPKHKAYHGVGLEDTSALWLTWADANAAVAGYTDIYGVRSTDGGASWAFPVNINLAGNTLYQVSTQTNAGTGAVTLYGATSFTHDIYQSTYVTDSRLTGDGRVIYSADKGATWATLHDFGHPVIYTALDPTNPNRLYASVVSNTVGGIYVTNDLSDGAASVWTELASPPRTAGHAYNVKVLDDGTLVATYSAQRATVNGVTQFTATSGVFYSTDGGQTWADRTLIGAKGSPGMQYWTKDVTIDPTDPSQNTWWAAVRSGYGGDGSSNDKGGLYRTTDRGLHWTRVFAADSCESCTIDAATGEMYVATTNSGLWYGTDFGGATPTFMQLNYPFHQPERIFINPNNPSDVWVASFGWGLAEGVSPFATMSGATLSVNEAGAGGPVTLSESGGTITAASASGSYSFSAASLSAISVVGTSGSDTLNVTSSLDKPVTFTGGGGGSDVVNVSGGAVSLSADTPNGTPTVTVNVNAGSSVTFTGNQHLAALNLNGGSVDIGTYELVPDATATSDDVIRGYVASGALTSAYVAAHPTYGIGYGTATDGVVGAAAGQLVVKAALLGDTTLKGSVGFGDYQALLSSFGKSSGATWAQGDFNADGAVTFGDYQALLANFGQTSALAAAAAPSAAAFVTAPAVAVTSSPPSKKGSGAARHRQVARMDHVGAAANAKRKRSSP